MVRLVPMSEVDFQEWRVASIENYAQEHVKAGNWDPAEAPKRAAKEFQQILPQGLSSKKQHLYSVEDSETGSKVGMIWFGLREEVSPRAFIYDFRVYEEYQRRGFGLQTLQALEEKVRELGVETISLHVFGHNHPAIALYKKAEYEVTDMIMSKTLKE